jgi:XRE family transcriptional regulator, regulator of sulfur utilization
MITRRDLMVATVASALMFVAGAFVTAQPSGLRSSTWDWSAMTAQPTKVGAVRRVVQSPTPTLDELEIHITTLNAGETSHPPHAHPDEELIIVKEGTVEAFNHGEHVRLGPGSVIFQGSNEQHGIKNVGDAPATYHVIRWNSPGMLRKKTP